MCAACHAAVLAGGDLGLHGAAALLDRLQHEGAAGIQRVNVNQWNQEVKQMSKTQSERPKKCNRAATLLKPVP
jgi:hypothetical protein